jgi:hypothetical protein
MFPIILLKTFHAIFIMRGVVVISCGVLMLWFCKPANAVSPSDSTDKYLTAISLNSDPVTGKKYILITKVSTLQVLYSEAPFSVELFLHSDLSMQFQAGIIFPLESDSFLEQFFRSGGKNSTASPSGIISYRTSPYNSHGLTFKYEIRKYLSDFYVAPQIMYKFSYYDDVTFRVYRDNSITNQTESKRTYVAGLGIMFGRQTYFMKQATDWYAGIGLRARNINATVTKEEDPALQSDILYTNSIEKRFSVYPFFNFGFRTGLAF